MSKYYFMKLLDHLRQGQLTEIERILGMDSKEKYVESMEKRMNEILGNHNQSNVVKEKEVTVRLTIRTAMTNYSACELVEQALLNSSLNNSEFCLVVKEAKVSNEKEVQHG